jgi:hypothetical protein
MERAVLNVTIPEKERSKPRIQRFLSEGAVLLGEAGGIDASLRSSFRAPSSVR